MEKRERLDKLYKVLSGFEDYYNRDNQTAKHSKRVEELAIKFSEILNPVKFNGYSKELIILVGKYHDIGKY